MKNPIAKFMDSLRWPLPSQSVMVHVDTESSFLEFLEFFAILTMHLAIIRRSSED